MASLPLDLISIIERGYERRDHDLPALSLYGWAMSNLDHEPDAWNEQRIHLSDYRYWLDPEEGGCERQLFHRLRQDEKKDPTLWERLMWDQGFALQIRVSWLIANGLPEGWGHHFVEADLTGHLPNGDTGSCDLVLAYASDGETRPEKILGVEFKTQRGRAFRYLDEPKESHRLQSEAEAYALTGMYPDADVSHALIYLDREGQNRPLVFATRTGPDTWAQVEAASTYVHSIAKELDEVDCPPKLDPKISIRENKGPNSIYLEQPWICDYCNFRPSSCPGALPDHLTGLGIVAKGDHEGGDGFEMKTDEDIESEVLEKIKRAVRTGNVSYK